MASDIEVRKVVQDVLLFVWFKNNIITKEPSSEPSCIPGISSDLIHHLRISVWLESKRIKLLYQSIVSSFWERMTCSPYVFANYVAYIFYVFCETQNAFAYFVDALALIAYLTEHCWQSEYKQFINASVDLFCAFFEKEIREGLENQGGWTHLDEVHAVAKYMPFIKGHKFPSESNSSVQDKFDQSENLGSMLNGFDINAVTHIQVENDERANNFAKSVEDRITELCKKEFDEILSDFERIDRQVKAMHQKTLDVTDESAGEVVHDIAQEVKKPLLDTPKNPMCEEKKLDSQESSAASLVQVQKSEDVGASNNSSNIAPTLSISNVAKDLLGEISMDISKLNGIILSLCEKHGVKVPERK